MGGRDGGGEDDASGLEAEVEREDVAAEGTEEGGEAEDEEAAGGEGDEGDEGGGPGEGLGDGKGGGREAEDDCVTCLWFSALAWAVFRHGGGILPVCMPTKTP